MKIPRYESMSILSPFFFHILTMCDTRPCMNELQKEYCVKIKLIALDWQWVTLISWCQMNRDIHSSPAIHKVEGETHYFCEKLKITPWKSTLFWRFFVKLFQITCVHICISQNTNDITPILHTCLNSSWSCFRSTAGYLMIPLWFWVLRVKKTKTIASSWSHGKLNFSEKFNF